MIKPNLLMRPLNLLKLLLSIFYLAICNVALAANMKGLVQIPQNNPHLGTYQHSQNKKPDLLKYVNTLQGTDSKYAYSHGNVYPTVALPHGMNFWSPQTGKNGDGWKYQYKAKTIRGFDEAHQSTPWGGPAPGIFSLMPVIGKLVVNENKRAAPFRHARETAKPNYYKVTFNNGITTQLAPTERGAFFQFDFPQSKKAYLVLDGYTKMSEVRIYPKQHKITGYIHNGRGVPKNFKNYFVMKFNRPFVSYGTWENKEGAISKKNISDEGTGVGAYVQFNKGAKVQIKVASSYISTDQAETTLERELGHFENINQVKEAAANIWNKRLSEILVTGGNKEDKETFYSCLFRANLFPYKIYEIDQKGNPHYYSPNDGKVYSGYHYTHIVFWDTFRSLFPLQNIINPTFQGRYMKSILSSYKHGGWFPGGGMTGNHVISVLADAWVKGIHTFDPDTALKAYFHEVTNTTAGPTGHRGEGRPNWKDYFILGYVPYPQGTSKNLETTARTLAYSYDDFCGYKLAKMIHNGFYKRIFARQMYNYKNVIDTTINFARGRDAQGNWDKNFNPYKWGGPFVEGSSWQWTWAVFHDIQGLINLMGGDKPFVAKLDSVFTASDSVDVGGYGHIIHEMSEMVSENMGQYAQGNQPSFQIPYLYDYAGQPWKTQKLVRTVMDKLYNAGPDGYPGDQDQGSMSSWYVLSALGFYSVTPGTNQYVVGSPLFKKAVITMEDGKKFVIKANNNSKSNVYIQRATLNGTPYSHNWITYKDIVNGGMLHFTMGNHPALKRGIKTKDRPFSLTQKIKKINDDDL